MTLSSTIARSFLVAALLALAYFGSYVCALDILWVTYSADESRIEEIGPAFRFRASPSTYRMLKMVYHPAAYLDAEVGNWIPRGHLYLKMASSPPVPQEDPEPISGTMTNHADVEAGGR